MQNLRRSTQIVGILGGLFVLMAPLTPAAASDVIHDRQWTIQIRPGNRGNRSTAPAESLQKRNVTPASYQEPKPEVVPVPESAPAKSETPAELPKSNGPALTPAAGPNPATHIDPAPRSVDLVPNVMPRTMSYEEAYAAVPFSRTEYEANPTYRHQAALELMFHTLRPTTMVQNFTPRAFRYPDSYQIPYGRSDTQHINIRNFGSGPNFNGQSPFGYPYGLKGNW